MAEQLCNPETTTINDQNTAPIERLYIHESAFGCLAMLNVEMAHAVGAGMAALRGRRLVSHRIGQAIELDVLSEETGLDIQIELVDAARDYYTVDRMLGLIAYRNHRRTDAESYVPVLPRGAQLGPTCFDENHYTLALTGEGAERMWSDELPFLELNRLIASGEGPADLVVIHGTNTKDLPDVGDDWRPDLLVVPELENISGPASRSRIRRRLMNMVLDQTTVLRIEKSERLRYLSALQDHIGYYISNAHSYSDAHADTLESMLLDMQASLNKFMALPSYGRRGLMEKKDLRQEVGPYELDADAQMIAVAKPPATLHQRRKNVNRRQHRSQSRRGVFIHTSVEDGNLLTDWQK